MKFGEWAKNIDKKRSLLLASKVGAAIIALVTIYLMYDQVKVMRQQSELLIKQNQTGAEEFRNNIYFQKLNRRTHLLSVLYDHNVHIRIRQETLYEYMGIDREVKEIEFRRQKPQGKMLEAHLIDEDGSIDWDRLVVAFPKWRTDLTGVVLSGMNLEFFDFNNVILNNADLSCSKLGSANFKRATLKNASFVGSELGGSHFEGATATSADFTGARLNGAYLNTTWLEDVTFDKVFFSKTNLGRFRSSPRSANLALILDLYDYDKSGGHNEFRSWAIKAGAKTGISYESWQQQLAEVTTINGITKTCTRTK